MKSDTTFKKNSTVYYHIFCIFTSSAAFFKNISLLRQLEFDLSQYP
jgi:hypothetical protein